MKMPEHKGRSAIADASKPATNDLCTAPAEGEHFVQFYEDEAFLYERVCRFLATGLIADEALVVIATKAHREELCRGLTSKGIDVERACATGRLTLLDARETLARFMVDGMPDGELFKSVIGTAIVARPAGGPAVRVRAYGEMVDLLWREGNPQAALRLEGLWNELGKAQGFSLLCAYIMGNFLKETDAQLFRAVCETHAHVLPSEGYAKIEDEEVRSLQQRARALESEVEYRKELEQRLRRWERLFQHAGWGVAIIHPTNHTLQEVNVEFARMHGYAVEEVLGRALVEMLCADNRNEMLQQERIAHETGHHVYEAIHHRRDGSRFTVLTDMTVIKDSAGDVIYRAASFQDISERKHAEERERAIRAQAEVERANMHALFTQAPMAVAMLVGPKHVFELANPLYRQMVNRPDILGKPHGEVFPELVGTPLPGILDRVYQTGEPFVTNEYRVLLDRRSDGKLDEAFFRFNLEPVRDATGHIYGQMAVAVEITEQVLARRAVEASELQFRMLIDTIPQLAWTARADGWIDFYNRRWYEYTGTTPKEMEGWGWQSVHDQNELPSVLKRWTLSIETGQPFDMSFPLRGADGVFRWHLTRVQPIRDAAGKVLRWFGTNTDIDSQLRGEKRLAEALDREKQAREEAERTVRFNEMFAGILGHDLRNPLSAITTSAEYMARSNSSEKVTKTASRILVSADRMARMIDQLLDFTRIRVGGGLALHLTRIHLSAVCRRVKDELEDAHPGCSIKMDAGANSRGEWDGDRLLQVFSNLVSNAIHHGAPNSPVTICIDDTSPSTVAVAIHNAGIIPPDVLPVLFEPFRGSRNQNTKGLGLGLFITQQIVIAHGGSINVMSNDTDGTTFRVRLPREPAAEAERQAGR